MEIAPGSEEMAGKKEMACCVGGYHVYKDVWAAAIGEVLVCCCWCVIVRKFFIVKLYLRKIFSYTFCVRKYFYREKKANYSTCCLQYIRRQNQVKGCTRQVLICYLGQKKAS